MSELRFVELGVESVDERVQEARAEKVSLRSSPCPVRVAVAVVDGVLMVVVQEVVRGGLLLLMLVVGSLGSRTF